VVLNHCIFQSAHSRIFDFIATVAPVRETVDFFLICFATI